MHQMTVEGINGVQTGPGAMVFDLKLIWQLRY
jgi:hypothetical protein